VLSRCRRLVGGAVVALGVAVVPALGSGAAGAAAPSVARPHASASAFCHAYDKLSAYQGNTKSLAGFRSSLEHLRSLVVTAEKVAPSPVKAHLVSFLRDEAQLKVLADRAKSYNGLKNSARAQAISQKLQSDGSPVDSYASSHCKS
jgi:hypothetical protein